jgi:hypothetical protein
MAPRFPRATGPRRGFDVDDPYALPVVQMVSAGQPIHAGQVHRAWSAMVQTAGSTEPAISVVLKWMPSRVKLAIELGCSLAATAIKLDVPRGMLVLADATDLAGLPAGAVAVTGDLVLCYGSVLRWPETARPRDGDAAVDEFIWQRFCESATAAPGAAWDELVANGDRHAGNFVFSADRYWLIDHDKALAPLADAVRRMTDLNAREQVRDFRATQNQVATQLVQRKPDDHDILIQPGKFEARTRALEALAARMSSWKTGVPAVDEVLIDSETIVRGIILRLPALGLQLQDRLARPPSALMWSTTHTRT